MAVDPKNLVDPDKVRNLMENARRLGRDDLVLACQVRLGELHGSQYDDVLEREFWIAVCVGEEIRSAETGRTTRFSRTRQKYQRDGARKCIEDLAGRSDVTDGFHILVAGGRPDLTFESVVLRHKSKFSPGLVEIAWRKLVEHGVDEGTIEGWMKREG